MRTIQLYIHIPFCQTKCAYCDFLSFESCGNERREYVTALVKEIELYKNLGQEVEISTIFVGGGTPSVLAGPLMEEIFQAIKKVFSIQENAEISIECNPGTVDRTKLESYKRCGIKRISLGLQATNNLELKNLGRIHSYETFLSTYHLIKDLGYKNINIDLMSAIPGQSVDSWVDTLNKIVALSPQHISAYSLIIEEGTKFWEEYGENKPREDELPSEEDERSMYHATKTILAEAGYGRYEVSNYAKEGLHCRHNLGYWDRNEYLGLGLGASSLLYNENSLDIQNRLKNVEDMKEYISMLDKGIKPTYDTESLSNTMQMEEFMFLGLRKMDGVSKIIFKETFGMDIERVYGLVLEDMYQKELLQEIKEMIRFTEKGIDLSNMVLSEFLKN